MHKSVMTTISSLILMSSLVMLAAAPFANLNSFSNTVAMAQEYDKYRESSYSQYPTDDKKYECRTGPLEGFFVSSVEFCKFKFDKDDDRKDNNRTGTQGPKGDTGATGATGLQGIQGPIGPNGTQGPAGPNQINQSLIYSVRGNLSTTSDAPLAVASSEAECDVGDVAIGGEFTISSFGTSDSIGDIRFLEAGTNGPSGNLDSYQTFIQTNNGSVQTISSIVVCFDNPPLVR